MSALATELLTAQRTRKAVDPLSTRYPELNTDAAYHIQTQQVAVRTAAGRRVVGHKIGLTSKAMQQLIGVNEPDFGHLLDDMLVPAGSAVDTKLLLQPKVEGEIAFLLKRDLAGPGISALDVLLATEAVMPAIEVADSRIKDWRIKLVDTVADNASGALFVLGTQWTSPRAIDLRLTGMVLEKNGRLINSGAGAEVLGHPAYAVAWLANKLAEHDQRLRSGQIILSGAITAATEVAPGDYIAVHFDRLGTVGLNFD